MVGEEGQIRVGEEAHHLAGEVVVVLHQGEVEDLHLEEEVVEEELHPVEVGEEEEADLHPQEVVGEGEVHHHHQEEEEVVGQELL